MKGNPDNMAKADPCLALHINWLFLEKDNKVKGKSSVFFDHSSVEQGSSTIGHIFVT